MPCRIEIAFFSFLPFKHDHMTEKEIINKLEELAIIKKVMIDKSNFDQATLIGEDERILRTQLEDLVKKREDKNQTAP